MSAWRRVAAALALLAAASPAWAQDGLRSLCFRAAPDRCRNSLITEFAGLIGPETGYRSPPLNFVWDAGVAHQLDARTAVGASFTVIADDNDRVMVGVRPRYRRWLSRRISLDFAPALLVGHTDPGRLRASYPSLSAYIGLAAWDLVSVNAQIEVLRHDSIEGTQTALLVGVRFGSYAGLFLGPAAAAFTAWVKQIGD